TGALARRASGGCRYLSQQRRLCLPGEGLLAASGSERGPPGNRSLARPDQGEPQLQQDLSAGCPREQQAVASRDLCRTTVAPCAPEGGRIPPLGADNVR